jgi:hypothetical protein
MGCGPRRHTVGRPSGQGAGTTTYQGVLRPHARGAAADVRDPAHDDAAAPRSADRDISGPYRHCRRGCGEGACGARKTCKMRGKDMFADMAIEELRKQIEHFCGLGDHVIDQTRRRMLDGEQVPADEKIYSIFEPHTDLIKRGKVRTPIEFGHKVFLAESARGLITQYEVLKGNPPDEAHVACSLRRHRHAFGRAPELYGSDRGFFSEQNLASCKHAGVKLVCIPQRGGKRTPRRGTTTYQQVGGSSKRRGRKKKVRFSRNLQRRLRAPTWFSVSEPGYHD